MQLDVCTGYGITEKKAVEALRITENWARRAKAQWEKRRAEGYEGMLFPIVQGNFFKDLRIQSAEFVASLDLPGIAIGGLSGGLAAGIAVLVKALMPQVRVIGVEHEESACLSAALAAGGPVTLERVGLFAEGVAVRRVGRETFRLCSALLDDVVTVSSDQVSAAVRDIFEDVRAVPEPSGALALAGEDKDIDTISLFAQNTHGIGIYYKSDNECRRGKKSHKKVVFGYFFIIFKFTSQEIGRAHV